MLLAGWTRLARVDRDGAVKRFDALLRARGLTEVTASPYALALGARAVVGSRSGSAALLQARRSPADLDDYALEWQARAAMWAATGTLVANTIAAMSDTQRGLTRWRYWAARAAERNGDTATRAPACTNRR